MFSQSQSFPSLSPPSPKAGTLFRECLTLAIQSLLRCPWRWGPQHLPHWWESLTWGTSGWQGCPSFCDGLTIASHGSSPSCFSHAQVSFCRMPPALAPPWPRLWVTRPASTPGLTSVCTRLTLWALSSRTQLKMSTTPSFSAMSSMVSMAMKQPVLPAPALQERTGACVRVPGVGPALSPRTLQTGSMLHRSDRMHSLGFRQNPSVGGRS